MDNESKTWEDDLTQNGQKRYRKGGPFSSAQNQETKKFVLIFFVLFFKIEK